MRVLILGALILPGLAQAADESKSCPLKSQQMKLVRECFTGDMARQEDMGKFIGIDEGSKEDMNYCYNAFVVAHPVRGGEVMFTVMKDNPKGQLRIFNYATLEQKLVPKAMGRLPASKTPTRISFKNLKAECFAKKEDDNQCSKGVFGLGSSDIPVIVELNRTRGGFGVKGSTKDEKALEEFSTKALNPIGEGDVKQTDTWLAQLIKQRLVSSAQDKLTMISKHKIKHSKLGEATTQFRYCRMAFEGFLYRHKIPDPFTDKDKKVLENLEAHLKTTAPIVP